MVLILLHASAKCFFLCSGAPIAKCSRLERSPGITGISNMASIDIPIEALADLIGISKNNFSDLVIDNITASELVNLKI